MAATPPLVSPTKATKAPLVVIPIKSNTVLESELQNIAADLFSGDEMSLDEVRRIALSHSSSAKKSATDSIDSEDEGEDEEPVVDQDEHETPTLSPIPQPKSSVHNGQKINNDDVEGLEGVFRGFDTGFFLSDTEGHESDFEVERALQSPISSGKSPSVLEVPTFSQAISDDEGFPTVALGLTQSPPSLLTAYERHRSELQSFPHDSGSKKVMAKETPEHSIETAAIEQEGIPHGGIPLGSEAGELEGIPASTPVLHRAVSDETTEFPDYASAIQYVEGNLKKYNELLAQNEKAIAENAAGLKAFDEQLNKLKAHLYEIIQEKNALKEEMIAMFDEAEQYNSISIEKIVKESNIVLLEYKQQLRLIADVEKEIKAKKEELVNILNHKHRLNEEYDKFQDTLRRLQQEQQLDQNLTDLTPEEIEGLLIDIKSKCDNLLVFIIPLIHQSRGLNSLLLEFKEDENFRAWLMTQSKDNLTATLNMLSPYSILFKESLQCLFSEVDTLLSKQPDIEKSVNKLKNQLQEIIDSETYSENQKRFSALNKDAVTGLSSILDNLLILSNDVSELSSTKDEFESDEIFLPDSDLNKSIDHSKVQTEIESHFQKLPAQEVTQLKDFLNQYLLAHSKSPEKLKGVRKTEGSEPGFSPQKAPIRTLLEYIRGSEHPKPPASQADQLRKVKAF